jgi:hypothetical protein
MTRRAFFAGAVGLGVVMSASVLLFHSLTGAAAPGAAAQEKAKYDASVERSEGLITATFTTPEGDKVQVHLPAVGRKISGTVVALPQADTPQERTERSSKLRGMVVAWENQKVPVEEKKKTFAWTVPAGPSGFFLMQLLDDQGRKLAQTPVYLPTEPAAAQAPTTFDIPRFFVADDNVVLRGPFNGDLGDTSVTWNNTPASLVAESEALAVCERLPGPNGPGELAVSEAGQSATQDSNKVALELATTAASTILKGTTADLAVTVRGCQGMQEDEELGLRVQINSPNIRWQGIPDPVFYAKITKAETIDGVYRKQMGFVGVQAGPYEIEATLSLFPDKHGEFTSKEVEHAWEISSLPKHDERPSKREPHADYLTKRNKASRTLPKHLPGPRTKLLSPAGRSARGILLGVPGRRITYSNYRAVRYTQRKSPSTRFTRQHSRNPSNRSTT